MIKHHTSEADIAVMRDMLVSKQRLYAKLLKDQVSPVVLEKVRKEIEKLTIQIYVRPGS